MKTQSFLRLIFLVIFILITTSNKGIEVTKNNNNFPATSQTINRPQDDAKTILFYILVIKNNDDAITDDEEHDFLHFHFERIKNSRRYTSAKIISTKIFLILMHLLMFLSPFLL